jgi:hypothetical protein
MAFHTLAYFQQVVGNSIAQLGAVVDGIMASQPTVSPTSHILFRDMRVLAAYAAGTNLVAAKVSAPSLLRVGLSAIRPTSRPLLAPTDPNLATWAQHPLNLRVNEPVSVVALHSGTKKEPVAALLWVADEVVPIPNGELFVLQFEMSGLPALTAESWSLVTPAFDQQIPPGEYSVIGFEHWSPGAICARLVFPGQVLRPGTLSLTGKAFPGDARTHRYFYEGALGVYGRFFSFAPPNIEVLSTSADANHQGYLQVIRLGDIPAVASRV